MSEETAKELIKAVTINQNLILALFNALGTKNDRIFKLYQDIVKDVDKQYEKIIENGE